jgi:hypothetical protein
MAVIARRATESLRGVLVCRAMAVASLIAPKAAPRRYSRVARIAMATVLPAL